MFYAKTLALGYAFVLSRDFGENPVVMYWAKVSSCQHDSLNNASHGCMHLHTQFLNYSS